MQKNQLTNAMKAVIANMVNLLKEGKTDEEVITASITDKIGDKECTTELLADLLGFAKEAKDKESGSALQSKTDSDTGKMLGNKAKDERYPFPVSWAKYVVIRESVETKIGNKPTDVAEIPSSVQIKPFNAFLFDTHIKQGMFKGKKVEIIHDPR
jgi:hypothetical protein